MRINQNNIIEDSDQYIDYLGNIHNIEDDIEQAEKDIIKMKQSNNVNFRWTAFEINRAKRIAEKLGMPYQTYLKSVLKQAMDKDEKRLM